jgi:hypothetical protein
MSSFFIGGAWYLKVVGLSPMTPFFSSLSFLSPTPENKFLSLLLLVFQIQSF